LPRHEQLLAASKPNHYRKKAITQKEFCPNASPIVWQNLLQINKHTCALSLHVALYPETAAIAHTCEVENLSTCVTKTKKVNVLSNQRHKSNQP